MSDFFKHHFEVYCCESPGEESDPPLIHPKFGVMPKEGQQPGRGSGNPRRLGVGWGETRFSVEGGAD